MEDLSSRRGDRKRSPIEIGSRISSATNNTVSSAIVWAYLLPSVAIVAGAILVAQLDYAAREQILISAIYTLIPLCIALGAFGRYATRLGFIVVATTFCSGLLYSGDMGGGWSHGVVGGMTTANAIVGGVVLLVASAIRKRFIRSPSTEIAGNHPMQPSGEVGRFEVVDQPSPPADR